MRSLIHDGQREAGLVVKRILDIVGAGLGLLLLSPLLLAMALVIRVARRFAGPVPSDARGPSWRPFTIYKFRSMVDGAEDQIEEVRHLNERSHVAFKATHDPRVTRMGSWLRKTSIDELPQLWNVLTGSDEPRRAAASASQRGRRTTTSGTAGV